MTTHSMDKAETLCKRMGIMVNGEFVCLGSANEIKKNMAMVMKLKMRIKTLKKEEMDKVLEMYNFDKKFEVNEKNINEILKKLIRKIRRKNILISWTHYIRNALKLIKKAKDFFDEIILTEYIENNFLFKIKKSENDNKSIYFYLFCLKMEKMIIILLNIQFK